MIEAALTVSLDQYLRTVYEPDVEFLDGVLSERNVGEFDHNLVQRAILFWFYTHERPWRIWSIQEQRTRVAQGKVRLPDVSVFSRSTPVEQVFTQPQLIAVEVLSPEDRHSRIDEKIDDYRTFGVPHIWIVDPIGRRGWDCSDGSWIRKQRLAVPASPIHLDLPELFSRIDQDRTEAEE